MAAAAALGGAESTDVFQAIDDSLRDGRVELPALPPQASDDTSHRRDPLGRTPLTYLIGQIAEPSGDAAEDAKRAACAAQVAEQLIARGADPDRADGAGARPLHLALAGGDAALVRCLLAHGASASAADAKGRTPLMAAVGALWPQPELVAALLAGGALPDALGDAQAAAADPQPVPLATAIIVRIRAIDDQRQGVAAVFDGPEPAVRATAALAIVTALLDAHAKAQVLIPGPSGFPWPALHAAVRAGDLELARLLLAHGAEAAGSVDNGLGLIGCAIDSGRPDLIGFLVAAGVPVDEPDARGNPAICRVEDASMLAALLAAGARPDSRRLDHRTLLHLAAEADNAEALTALLDHGASIDSLLDPGGKPARAAANAWLVGKTPLWAALEGHHPHAVLALLRRGAAVRVRLADGTTMLHLAATWSGPLIDDPAAPPAGGLPSDAVSLVRLLVAEGADPNARTAKPANGRAVWDRTPLHFACQAHALDTADALLVLGADPALADSAGCPPWRLALGDERRRGEWVARFAAAGVAIADSQLRSLDLRKAFADGDGQRARALLADDPSLASLALAISADDPETTTPLHLAIALHDRELVELLLSKGAAVAAYDGRGRSPLHRAVETDQDEIVRLLVAHGGDVNGAVRVENGEAITPLLIALGRSPGGSPLREPSHQVAMAKLLLELGADPDRPSGKDHCPLEAAVAAGNLAAVQLLLEHGAKPSFCDSAGHTLLHLVSWGSAKGFDIAELLLAKGVEVDRPDTQRQETPLHRVARGGKGATVRWLVAHGADPSRRDARQWTPLHLAAESGNLSAVDELIASHADLDAADHDGLTPLIVAIEAGQGDVVARLLEHHAHGAETDAATVRGWAHLKQGQHYKLKALLDQDPAIAKGRLIRGETLLMRAADRQDAITVRLLLDRQAEPDAQDDLGRTSLMHALLAVAGDDLAVPEMLVKAGCDPNHADRSGATAVDLVTAKRATLDRRHAGTGARLLAFLAACGATAAPPRDGGATR